MDPLLTIIIVAVVACLIGVTIGWRVAMRRYHRFLVEMEHETGARSLELLETRQHLRKISGHLKGSLKKDKTIRQLRARQKSLQRKIDHHVLRARRQEKAHYIQTAKIKLELIEARLQSQLPTHNAQPDEDVSRFQSNGHAGEHNDDNYLTGEPQQSDAPANGHHRGVSGKESGNQEYGAINSELQLLLKKAGIRRVRQLANLSNRDIDQLTSLADRHTAE